MPLQILVIFISTCYVVCNFLESGKVSHREIDGHAEIIVHLGCLEASINPDVLYLIDHFRYLFIPCLFL